MSKPFSSSTEARVFAFSTTTLGLSVDEDQLVDSERSHTPEQIAYVAFAGDLVYPAEPTCFDNVER